LKKFDKKLTKWFAAYRELSTVFELFLSVENPTPRGASRHMICP